MSDEETPQCAAVPSRRYGRNRELVLHALEHAPKPLGAYELLELLRDEGIRSPLQIYRALDQLIQDGTVHKIESISAYAICTHLNCPDHGHAAFAICKNCGKTDEINDATLHQVLQRLAREIEFTTHSSTVELLGLCRGCADE